MNAPAATSNPPAAPSPNRQKWATVVLVLFCLYVASLYVLALDQHFNWGLFPSKEDKQLTTEIQQLGDSSLAADKRQALMQDIVDWHSFSVPNLLNAIEKGSPAVRDPAVQCLQQISQKYYNTDLTPMGSDPVKLRKWWADLQDQWAKAEAANEKK